MRVLQLYNVFGAMTERTMLSVPMGLASRGVEMAVGCERVADEALEVGWDVRVVDRIEVEATGDVVGQMEEIAAGEPAVGGAFDLVQGHFGPRVLHGSRYLKRGVPMVVSCYGYDVSRLLRDACWAERYAWAGREGAVFVALSESMKRTLVDCGVPVENIRVIRLGIVLDDWLYEESVVEDPARFVFIGRLTGKKAPQDVVAALPEDAVLDVVGSGELDDTLRAQVKASGSLRDRVRFLGRMEVGDLPGVLRGATGFVLPSVEAADGDKEGMPMILMQALAAGVPCVTTDHAGNAEVIPPGDRGRCVVGESDIEALRAAMVGLMGQGEEERRIQQRRGRAWVEEQFDIDQTVGGYERVYRQLADG